MILINEFLRKESIKRDISNASETRILNENYTVFSKKNHMICLLYSYSILYYIIAIKQWLSNAPKLRKVKIQVA